MTTLARKNATVRLATRLGGLLTLVVAFAVAFATTTALAQNHRDADATDDSAANDVVANDLTANDVAATHLDAGADATAASLPTGRLIVKYRQRDSAPGFITKAPGAFDRRKWRAKRGLLVNRELSNRQELLSSYYNDRYSAAQAALLASEQSRTDDSAGRRDQTESHIEFVSPEYIRHPRLFPNDPLFEGNLIQGSQSYLYDGTYSARAPGAWDITTGSESSVIAIVDTGVLSNHPDLADRSVAGLGFDFISANNPGDFTNANDGDGRDNDPTDPGDNCLGDPSSWHGTEVASVAGASANDGLGIAGIDWNARLLHARALGRCGGTDADIIDAVRWSAGIEVPGIPSNPTPAQVINLSIGGATECTRAWQDVIDEVNALDVKVVISAGNEALNALRSAPANCANAITVGSSDMQGGVDEFFTNYGLKVTVGAPGRDILLATNEGLTNEDTNGHNYGRETGSSLSAAIVSGTVSLMHSLNPNLTSADVRAILQHSATPFAQTGECSGYYCGAGILNMSRALAMTRDNSFDPDRNQERDIVDARARSLPLNLETAGNLIGYRDILYYEIDTPTDGMLTVTSSSEENLFGYLLDDRYGVLALDDNSAGNRQFRVASAVTAGRYYLAVERTRSQPEDGESAFTLFADLGTDQPTPFTFADISNAAGNSTVTSNTIEISGLSATALLTISGGFYSLNEGALTDIQALVGNGDQITLAVKTAGAGQSTTTVQLSVGAYSTTFVVTTGDEPKAVGRAIRTSGGCSLSGASGDPTLSLLFMAALGLIVRRRTAVR